MARHAHLVGEQRDLDQVLDHHAEHDVVRDLADAREFAVADIGHAARREHLDQRHGGLAGRLRAGDDGGELAGLDDLGVAAHRRGDEIGAELLELVADRGGFLDRDGRAIDHDRRQLAALAAHAVLAVEHVLHVLAGVDDREQHVDVFEIGQMVDDLAADLGERLGLGARAIPDRNVMAGLDQPLGHGQAHAAHADPADLLRVLRGHAELLCEMRMFGGCPSTGGGGCNGRANERLVPGRDKRALSCKSRCTTLSTNSRRPPTSASTRPVVARGAQRVSVRRRRRDVGGGRASRTVSRRNSFPSLETIAATFVRLTLSGVLPHHALGHAPSPHRRLSRSRLWSASAIGVLMGRSRRAEDYLLPLISIGAPIPGLAYAPLFLLWFGPGNVPSVLLVAFVSTFPIIYNSWTGVKAVKDIWVRSAHAMGADDRRLFRHVILPGALPYIMTGLRLGLAQAWRILVAVEMLAAVPWGLGWLIFGAQEFLNTDVMLAGIAVIALIGVGAGEAGVPAAGEFHRRALGHDDMTPERMRSLRRGSLTLLVVAALYEAVARSGYFAPALMPTLGTVAQTLSFACSTAACCTTPPPRSIAC